MARFYTGQPVVCISMFEEMRQHAVLKGLGFTYPVKGQRYTVADYHEKVVTNLYVMEIPVIQKCARGTFRVFWSETQFAPITDEQVRGIIEEAHKGPVDELAAKREEAWWRLKRKMREAHKETVK